MHTGCSEPRKRDPSRFHLQDATIKASSPVLLLHPQTLFPGARARREKEPGSGRPASPCRRPRRCRCRPAGPARSPAAGSASGCPPQAAAGPPSSLRACPAGSARGARLPLTRTRGAASQHGASDRSSACTRDRPAKAGRRRGRRPRAAQPPSFRRRRRARRSGPGRVPGSPQPRPDRSPSPPRPPAHCPARLPPSAGPGAGSVPEGAAPLRGAPRPDLLPRRRLRPTSGACVLLPSGARSPTRRSPSRAAGPCGTARPRGQRRRVRWPPLQSHHVRHPGLRHRETRSRPAGVGAQRLSRPSAPAAGPERRPEAGSGHDSLPGAPLARRVCVRPRRCYRLQRVGAPWAFIRGPAGLGSTAPRCVR